MDIIERRKKRRKNFVSLREKIRCGWCSYPKENITFCQLQRRLIDFRIFNLLIKNSIVRFGKPEAMDDMCLSGERIVYEYRLKIKMTL